MPRMLITGTIFTKLKVHKFTSEDISMMLGLEQSMTKCLISIVDDVFTDGIETFQSFPQSNGVNPNVTTVSIDDHDCNCAYTLTAIQ